MTKRSPSLRRRFRDCKLLALDFDGVLTDNRVLQAADGSEAVIRSRADSLGIDLLADAGLYSKKNYRDIRRAFDIVILSRETNRVVAAVARKIKVKCAQSRYDKLTALKKEVGKRKLDPASVIFMGNDVNDLACMAYAGLGIAVADAHPSVLAAAGYVTRHNGGNGALREVCELILSSKNRNALRFPRSLS